MRKIVFSGGLGNQMFQYAFYLALKKQGINAIIDDSLYRRLKMHNGFELMRVFDINEPIFKSRIVKIHLLIIRLLMKFPSLYFLSYKDSSFLANKRNLIFPRTLYYLGYWQSKDIVNSIINDLRKTFVFYNLPSSIVEKGSFIHSVNSVSLHIRRGDYLEIPAYHGICDELYYERAIAYIKRHVSNPCFYVFSNDIAWAMKFLDKFKLSVEFVDNLGVNSHWDMYLMSKCQNHIIANSTFSWWAAVLDERKDKIVISPTKFKNNEIIDIILEDWVKISNT